MVSDEQFRRIVDEIARIKRQIANLKAKVKRRSKNLEKTLDPLERQRIEFEIELLNRNIKKLQIEEIKRSLPLIKGMAKVGAKVEDGIDWSKAAKA
ncbi:MAG: hypothetical protein ACE144_09420 [Thermodesulfobacteriota bacterium]